MLNLDLMFDKFGKVFQPDEIIFCEYEPGNDFYLIQSGRVKITKVVSDNEKTLDILKSGAIFGEMAILEQQPRSATAIAIDEVKVLNFNKENFEMLLKGQPDLALQLLRVFCTRIFDANRRLMILLLKDPNSRVADVFLMLAEQSNISKTTNEPVEIKTTVEEIANWSGIPITDCQKVIAHYGKIGKIKVYPDRIIVNNISELNRLVQNKRKMIYDG